MIRALPVLVLAALLAGCAQPAAQVATSATPVVAATDPFHPAFASDAAALVPPRVIPDVLVAAPGFAEPNIAASYDGRTLYVGNPGDLWRSDDAGATWTHPKNAGIEGGGDGDIAVDAAGTLYYLGLFGKEKRTIPFMTSQDKGESWSTAVDVAAGSGFDREWIDVTPEGAVYTAWRGTIRQTDSGPAGLLDMTSTAAIEFNASPDGGKTWTGKVKVGADGDGGPIAHDAKTGAIVIPVVDQADTAGTSAPVVHIYRSLDGGASWTESRAATLGRSSPLEPNGYASDFPVAAFDGNGTLYLVYSADSATSPGGVTPPEELGLYGIFLQVSHDQGATWTKPLRVSDASKDARFPWIAAGAPGRVAIVWYENTRGLPGEMLPDEWNVKLYESIDADAAAPKGILATLTATPNHLGSLCTAGATCLASDRSMLDFFEVAIGANGQPLVAFASSTLGTGIGPAVKKTEIRFGTVEGTRLI